jgi:hypothetical protein
MQEICQSGSEGGAKRTFVPTPISAQGFNPGSHPNKWFALKGREMRTPLTCVVATFDLAPLQGAPPWDGVPGVETPG